DEVGAHQAARLGGVVAEQRAHLHAVADGQEREDALAAVLLELADHVDGVVGSHAGEDLGDLLVAAILEELALVLVVELLEDVGLELPVVVADGLDDLLALLSGGGLDEVGDLGGVELGELRVGHAQADGRDVADERLDARPVEELAGRDVGAERLGQQAPQAAAGAGVDADDPPGAADEGELDLVGANEARALDVDQLTVEQVALEQDLLGAPLEVAQVELRLAQHDPARADVRDALHAEVGPPPGDGHEHARDPRIADAAEADDQILDLAEPLAVGVAQRAADDRREMED